MIQSRNEILRIAKEFDDVIETKDINRILSFFTNDCEIELLGVKLTRKDGAKRWLKWMFQHIKTITFKPVTLIVEGNIFFEEFVVKATLYDGTSLESKQAEVLVYENSLVKSLRLYFDRLDFAKAIAKGFLSQAIVTRLLRKTLKGLVEAE